VLPAKVEPLTASEVDRCVEAAIAALRRMPYAEYLRTAHWQRQRALALDQAGHTCDLCGRPDRLEVHHRTYERVGFERQRDLIVLCHDCHRDHHKALMIRAIRATEQATLAISVSDVLAKTG
jgi:5-methylcytosine-specific restriction endonuclease McrA